MYDEVLLASYACWRLNNDNVSFLSLSLSLSAIGVSYFVYGEMVDTYSGDPKLQEFKDVGLKLVQSIASIANALPLYRLHIYTKPYRDFVDALNKVQDRGMLVGI